MNKSRVIGALCTCLCAICLSNTSSASTIVAGTIFDDNAFADSLISSAGSWNFEGGASSLEDALVGSNPDDFAYSSDTGANVVLGFSNNLIFNGPGADLSVFELGDPDAFALSLTDGGATIIYTTVATGFMAGGYRLNEARINLDDFGLAPGATINQIQLFNSTVTPPAEFTVIGAINSTAVPIPPALWLFGSGLLGLIGIARKKAA